MVLNQSLFLFDSYCLVCNWESFVIHLAICSKEFKVRHCPNLYPIPDSWILTDSRIGSINKRRLARLVIKYLPAELRSTAKYDLHTQFCW